MDIRDTTLFGADRVKIPPSMRSTHYGFFDDFDEGETLSFATGGRWTVNTVQTAGTPSVALVADTAAGEVQGLLEATSESQRAEVYFGDQLSIDITKNPIVEARIKFGTIAANEFAVFGLASARNDTYDSVATHAWFRLDGDMDILIEGDDGTTDTDDQDSGIDAVANTYLTLEINASHLDAVEFKIDGTLVSTKIDISAATGQLQVFAGVGKSTGTGIPSFTLDYVSLEVER